MASEVSIANRALQKLGARRITSFTDDTKEARAVNTCYTELRDAELRAHPWCFATKRVILAPLSTAPAFDYGYAFQLPADCVRVLKPNRTYLDWKLENGVNILTNDGDTLELVYTSRVEDPNMMDPLFREALAARIAMELCEELTQSNQKFQILESMYTQAMRTARRTNGFEKVPEEGPQDTWLAVRY